MVTFLYGDQQSDADGLIRSRDWGDALVEEHEERRPPTAFSLKAGTDDELPDTGQLLCPDSLGEIRSHGLGERPLEAGRPQSERALHVSVDRSIVE